jgi:hypothetical protein
MGNGIFISLAVILISFVGALLILTSNPGIMLGEFNQDLPPGCTDSRAIGGCYGKNRIINASVNPQISCIKLRKRSCTGAGLTIHNSCESTVEVGRFRIPEDGRQSIQLKPSGEGYEVTEDVRWTPNTTTSLRTEGVVGSREFELRYYETGNLC